MVPPPGSSDERIRRNGTTASLYKPPLPTQLPRLSQQTPQVEILLPPLLSGALVTAFAKAVADGLNNELLTHYYLTGQKVRINLDRVLDRLLHGFTKELWDELFYFYHDSGSPPSRQVTLLFDGPIRQVVLVLNGPETTRCLLDKLAPGLSRRPATWSVGAKGIDLPLALQLACGYWHREYPNLSPGGSPNDIARSLHHRIVRGNAAQNLLASIRKTLMTPHMVQMYIMESAIWDIISRRPFHPPADGFNAVQFRFEGQIFGPRDGIGNPRLADIGSLHAITGTTSDCNRTTVLEYTTRQWPTYGRHLLGCLQDAVASATDASRRGEGFMGMALRDGSDTNAIYCPGLRLLHIEVENSLIRLSISAWAHAIIDVLQQMAWMCAALSTSPFPGKLSECVAEVSDWQYLDDSIFIDCSLAHRPLPDGEGFLSLQHQRGATIATGFPVNR